MLRPVIFMAVDGNDLADHYYPFLLIKLIKFMNIGSVITVYNENIYHYHNL